MLPINSESEIIDAQEELLSTPPISPSLSSSTKVGESFERRLLNDIIDFKSQKDPLIEIHVPEKDMTKITALLVGPSDTPYENGLFQVYLDFPSSYPYKSPSAQFLTNDHGTCRFNPSFWADGKICLSIFGTCHENGDQWSSAQNIKSLLLSVISIFSDNPFDCRKHLKYLSEKYKEKIVHETIRVSIVQPMENLLKSYSEDNEGTESKESSLFARTYVQHFMERFHFFLDKCDQLMESLDGENFVCMPFEYEGNSMDGIFEFGKLWKRLVIIHESVSSKIWNPKSGSNFFNQLKFINNLDYVVESKVVGPFHYELTLLAPEGSPFEGYLIPFEIKTSTSSFLPYIRFLCPIYHPLVSDDGIPFLGRDHSSSFISYYIKYVYRLLSLTLKRPYLILNSKAAQDLEKDRKVYHRNVRKKMDLWMEVN